MHFVKSLIVSRDNARCLKLRFRCSFKLFTILRVCHELFQLKSDPAKFYKRSLFHFDHIRIFLIPDMSILNLLASCHLACLLITQPNYLPSLLLMIKLLVQLPILRVQTLRIVHPISILLIHHTYKWMVS